MRRFYDVTLIAEGGFGIVSKAKDVETNQTVAIKKMKQKYSNFEQCIQLKEVKSLRKIKHENVVRLLQVFREHECLYLVFEFLRESLHKTIQQRTQPFSDAEVRFIISQILNGVAIIHKQGFFHRDIKPDNILWGENHSLKIADFGLAREIRSRPPYTEYVGTRWYRAPEIIFRHPFYNSPVDIWSVGCLMAELYTLKPIFPGTTEIDQIFRIANVLGQPTAKTWPDFAQLSQKRNIRLNGIAGTGLESIIPNASPDAIDLISSMLQWDPTQRPSAMHALRHRFFQAGEKVPPLAPGLTKGSGYGSSIDANTTLQPLNYHSQIIGRVDSSKKKGYHDSNSFNQQLIGGSYSKAISPKQSVYSQLKLTPGSKLHSTVNAIVLPGLDPR